MTTMTTMMGKGPKDVRLKDEGAVVSKTSWRGCWGGSVGGAVISGGPQNLSGSTIWTMMSSSCCASGVEKEMVRLVNGCSGGEW